MATKKKTKNKTIQQEPIQDQKTAVTDNTAGYAGTVRVSILSGKKTLSTKTYHNRGRQRLFRFICNALAGNLVEELRPCKVAAFKLESDEEDPAAISGGSVPKFSDACIISPYLLNDVSAVLKHDTTTDTWQTIYHFRIPYAYLQTDKDGKINIYKLGLYPTQLSGDALNDQCAYFCFAKQVGDKKVWDPIVVDSAAVGNFSLVIEWIMTVSNKQ